MKIGIIVAMGKELSLLEPLIEGKTTENYNHNTFLIGRIGPHQVIAIQCGIGKVNAAITTEIMISRYQPQLVINTGVAGAADKGLSILDVVVGSDIAYHDVWCGPENPVGSVQGLPLFYHSEEHYALQLQGMEGVNLGLICSGDQFIDSAEQLDKIRSNFPQVLAVDMESAAIAQVCYLHKQPYLCIRVISDSPALEADNTSQYLNFWDEAPLRTFHIIQQLFMRI